MTATEAIRRIMRERANPISLRELQLAVEIRTGRCVTDGTCSRRLRDMNCKCERDKFGVYRYWLPKPAQQETLFAERRSA